MINWKINLEPLQDPPTDKEFLRCFYRSDNSKVYLRAFNDKCKKDARKLDVDLLNYNSVIPTLKRYNSLDMGIFFVVNGGGQDSKAVIKSGVCQAQFMEIDDFKMEDQIQVINAFPLKPSIVVKTKKSLHTYWLVNDGDIRRFRDIQIKLSDLFKSDPHIQDEARTMRLPNYYHQKEEPVLVEVIHFEPDIRYTQDEIIEAINSTSLKEMLDDTMLSDEVKNNILSLKTKNSNKTDNRFVLPEVIPKGERNDILYRYGCSLQAKGYSDDDILSMLEDANSRCEDRLEPVEISRIYDSVLTKDKGTNDSNKYDPKLSKFHRWSKPDKSGVCHPIDTIDNTIAEDIIKNYHIFALKGKLYLYKNGLYEIDDNGSMFKTLISTYIYEEIITEIRLTRIYKLLLTKYKIQIELSDVNRFPKTWIPFKNGMLDITTLEMHSHKPEYNCINQIPYEWKADYEEKDSVVNDFISGTIPNDDDRKMFLQYIGYCLTTSTEQQKFLIICGDGGVGKSVLLMMAREIIGSKNYSGLTLQNLNDRFSPVFLMGKLANIYADLPSTDMTEINGIKTITGDYDMVRAEYKGGEVFHFKPYCKLLYSANKIPKSRDDKTDAYYRRMLILRINQRGDFIPDLESRLLKNMDSFVHSVVNAIHEMYVDQEGRIFISDNSKSEVEELHKQTDTIYAWISEGKYTNKTDDQVERKQLYQTYKLYCMETDRLKGLVSSNNFYATLRENGYREHKSNGDYYFYIAQNTESQSLEDDDPQSDLPF